VAKIFKGKDTSLMYAQFKSFFKFVQIVKPSSSRVGSIEAFLVCQHFQLPDGYVPALINPISNRSYSERTTLAPLNEALMPYTSSGDLTGFDSLLLHSTAGDTDAEFEALLAASSCQASSSHSSL